MPEKSQELQELKKNFLWFYIKQNKGSFTLGMIFLLLTNALDAFWPLLLKEAIDLVANRAPAEKITQTAIAFFAMMSGLAITRYGWRTYFGKYHTYAAEDLRYRVFHHLTEMGPNFFHKNPIGELMSLIINDVQAVRQALGHAVLVLFDGIIISALVLPIMIWMNPSWTWKTMILLPLVPFAIKKIMHLINIRYKAEQDRQAELSGVAQEIAAGIRVIKSYVQEKNRLKYYNQYSKRYEDAANKTAVVDAVFEPVMEFGVATGTVILLFIATEDIFSGAATIGTLVAFERYITKMIWPMTAIGMGLTQFQKGKASFARICELLNQDTDIPDNGTEEIRNFESLEVKNLSYQYPGAQTASLHNISFSIKAGQKVGVVGPVGSGKTTLLHLLNRLYPAPEKSILVNGKSIEQIKQKNLHENIVLVPQEPFLFSDSINENLSYGLSQKPEEKEIHRWAEMVDIRAEIEALPEGFKSQLGERGVNLSGGQKQRLTIARGLMMQAPFLMLDDALSAVDVKTETEIKRQLKTSHQKNQTQLIVAHRLSSVEDADQIIVLKDGMIESIGSHKDLISKSPTYKKLAEIQGYPT
ncbi:MAG: putative multidrug resistance ABC transporter ATP-binding/permease protein YheI [Oligoflexia bacterium]|nr:MAG: putative multidrug resistance ABC transporter ATP-binding/permease protein YheI [Oligoflexia bacterium]